ncbi:MAG: GrpB family protein [Chloroflexi bacterium]|nr:GrpB family protein [Chloroflexota bacterium]
MPTSPIVVAYDPRWPREFEELAAVLAAALGDLALAVHHVGSTSIPGMAAKPVLDIDIELAPGVPVEAATAVLSPLGYAYKGDQGIPERYAYRNLTPAAPFCEQRATWPPHHLYVCPHGSRELSRHLLFRDKLRRDPALRQEYLEIKQEALRRAEGVRQVYVDEKAALGDAFFRRVLGD